MELFLWLAGIFITLHLIPALISYYSDIKNGDVIEAEDHFWIILIFGSIFTPLYLVFVYFPNFLMENMEKLANKNIQFDKNKKAIKDLELLIEKIKLDWTNDVLYNDGQKFDYYTKELNEKTEILNNLKNK